jgi:hypothetical protein
MVPKGWKIVGRGISQVMIGAFFVSGLGLSFLKREVVFFRAAKKLRFINLASQLNQQKEDSEQSFFTYT